MIDKILVISTIFYLMGAGHLQAQNSPVASGGEATGVGGGISYTVGQIAYTTNSGSNGSIAQGLQQPYEISTILGIEETDIHLEMSIYPNPTSLNLTLKTTASEPLNYQLSDINGKIITANEVTAPFTKINLKGWPAGMYFLKINRDHQSVKIFKIIKK